MSSHYSYDIDERNLRLKLKGNETPFTEDIWLKFESYQQTHQKQQSIDDVVKKFSFKINRNVVLPIVFGTVIIAFSLLLLNFINIKAQPKIIVNTPNTNLVVKKIELKPNPIKKTGLTQPTIINKDTVAIKTTSVSITPTVAIITPTVTTIVNTPIIANETAEAWVATEDGTIFEEPDKSSKIIGKVQKKQSYSAIKETNYFIKVAFNSNGKQEEGYIKKMIVLKNVKQNINLSSKQNTSVVKLDTKKTKKKKLRKAESLQSINVPNILSTNAGDKEPELR